MRLEETIKELDGKCAHTPAGSHDEISNVHVDESDAPNQNRD